MLVALSWEVLSSDNNCSDPEEEEISPHTEHVDLKDDLDKELSIAPPPATVVQINTKPLTSVLTTELSIEPLPASPIVRFFSKTCYFLLLYSSVL